jgi:small subunit ribosomal protein S20
MANIRSVAKRARQAEKRRARNAALRAELRTARKKVQKLVETENAEQLKTDAQVTLRLFDKMVTKNIIHKNKAARYKSRLMAKVNKLVPDFKLEKVSA